MSFGTRQMDWGKRYIREQKQRHAARRVVDRLERITALEDEAEAEPREAP